MSKLPVVSSNDFIKFIVKEKGYSYLHTRGDHHIYVSKNGRVSVPERKELGKGLFLALLEEVGSNRDEFLKYWNG
ncbi:MAG: type II toxin-antitoxin system HicA family toxin [Candidatus Nitrosotenuis sp.]|nr:type II toxin-antitoxin system HicA family toxin [Candidatus Nitrosotenuis sp.]